MIDILLANLRPTTLAEVYNDLAVHSEQTDEIERLSVYVWLQLATICGEGEAFEMLGKVLP